MSLAGPVFTEYERLVIHQIAAHRVQPNAVHRLLETVGRPVGKLFKLARESQNLALRGLSEKVGGLVQEGLIKSVQAANRITGTKEITRRMEAQGIHITDLSVMRYLPMSQLDKVADSFQFSSRMALGIEGALLGGATTLAEGIPGAQLIIPSLLVTDVTASVTLLSRQTCRIAGVYGYSPKVPENLPHILAAMAPETGTSDEGCVAIKTAVVASIRESGRFLARSGGVVIDRQLLQREAPQMIRLIGHVAERLGVTVTQKELGILVPIAGAVLNSSINIAFQQVGHQTAKDYFRRLLLEERYGEELVSIAVTEEMEALRNGKPRPAPAPVVGDHSRD
jgi:hypothetical protein